MELILLEKIVNLGDLGETVDVKPGFGRNYLVPAGKAIPATKENIAQFESRREELERAASEKQRAAETRRDALAGTTIKFMVNTSAEGKLYGSIGPREVADRLTDEGFAVEKSEVIMGEGPIRFIGTFEVPIHLHADVDTLVSVVVESEDGVVIVADDSHAEDAVAESATDSEE